MLAGKACLILLYVLDGSASNKELATPCLNINELTTTQENGISSNKRLVPPSRCLRGNPPRSRVDMNAFHCLAGAFTSGLNIAAVLMHLEKIKKKENMIKLAPFTANG